MRRREIVQLTLLAALFAGVATILALFIPWLPKASTREADRIFFVYWFVTGISIFVFATVAAALTYSLMHFRARPGDDSDGPPIHGHTKLEIFWTAVPAVLVTAIAIVSAIVLAKNDDIPKSALAVDVTGVQFTWIYKYPDLGNVTSDTLRVPLGRSVSLNITAQDVLHSFWVPQFAQKQDAVPGQINRLKITPTRLGSYEVICTELCGLGHATMRSKAIVMKSDEFDAWIRAQREALGGPPKSAGAAIFAEQSCGSCHTLKAAGATGTVGPDLDKLPEEAKTAGKPLEQFVKDSIVDPEAYVQKGYPHNLMPQTFGQLPQAQVSALVQYLVDSTKK